MKSSMRKFAVLIGGTGYNIIDELSQKMAKGFYITVFVEAKDIDKACQQAIDFLINSNEYANAFLPDQHPNGMLEVEDVDELTSFKSVPYPMTGFCIYMEDGHDIDDKSNH